MHCVRIGATMAWLALVAAPGTTRAAIVVPVGNEIQVNAYTQGLQLDASASMAGDGTSVLVWTDYYGRDGDSEGVFGRRFNSIGVPLANEFQVNLYTGSAQGEPVVSMGAGGDFIVVWESFGQDGANDGIFLRRFDSNGAGVGVELQVPSRTANVESNPSIARDGEGDFVVVWQSSNWDGDLFGIIARRFDSDASPVTVEFQVNDYTVGSQFYPTVAMNSAGAFIVVWESDDQDGSARGVFARRFNFMGGGGYSEFKINVVTLDYQQDPAVAMRNDGTFTVIWQSTNQDGSSSGVFGRRFLSAGGALGPDFQVNLTTEVDQGSPALGVESDGDFVVVWAAGGSQDGGVTGVFGRRFNSAGKGDDTEFQINAYTTGIQSTPTLGWDGDGDFVVGWNSSDQDGDTSGIFARRMRIPARLDVDGNGVISPLTDGLLTLRFEFGFTGAVLIGGAVDLAGCTRCTAEAITAYLVAESSN